MSALPMYGQVPQGMDMSSMLKLMRPQAPQGLDGGQQTMGGGQLPGMPPGLPGQSGMGQPPSASIATTAGRDKVANAMMGSAGKQLAQSGNPAMSGVGGALQGAQLYGLASGKSPMGAMRNMMGLGGGSSPSMPTGGGTDPMSFANMLSGMPPDPAKASALGEFGGTFGGVPGAEAAATMGSAYADALGAGAGAGMGAGAASLAPAIPAQLGMDAAGAAGMLESMGGAAEAAPWFASLFESGGPLAALALL